MGEVGGFGGSHRGRCRKTSGRHWGRRCKTIMFSDIFSEDIVLRRRNIMTEEEDDEYSDSKLPIIASKISQTGIAVGIGPQFMQKETTKLLDSIEKFVKAIQKRGI